ncbi:MAG TPA: tetratricopeptide repeat protein, partial [Steroidobacteraceae bacterium]
MMKLMLKGTIAAICLTASFAAPVAAGPLEDAIAAYGKGNYATALLLLRPLAEQGTARAQILLGVMYSRGQGMAQNYGEAMKWYRQAADHGDATAQVAVGAMLCQWSWRATGPRQGNGVVSQSCGSGRAMKWYRRAADQGYANAQSNIAIMYNTGHGVPQDYAEGLKWSRLAAEQGFAAAQY